MIVFSAPEFEAVMWSLGKKAEKEHVGICHLRYILVQENCTCFLNVRTANISHEKSINGEDCMHGSQGSRPLCFHEEKYFTLVKQELLNSLWLLNSLETETENCWGGPGVVESEEMKMSKGWR